MQRIDVLVVAEKSKVARKLALCLSKGNLQTKRLYDVNVFIFFRKNEKWGILGLAGHIINYDFPKECNRWNSINPKMLFSIEPIKVIRKNCIKYVNVLKELGRHARLVILALDADVEGEGIAFEVIEIIRKINPYVEFKRALFSSLECKEIEDSFNSLREPNIYLASKVYARMKLDLTIGAAFTRALTLSVQRRNSKLLSDGHFLSYGPCQTPVLYLVVNQALKRENFVGKKYYELEVMVDIKGSSIRFISKKRFEKMEEVKKVYEHLQTVKIGIISSAAYIKKSKSPPKPLDTIELERRCSKFLNIRSKNTLDIAESLYRDGMISYPRTETTIYPKSFNFKKILDRLKFDKRYGEYIRLYIKYPLSPTKGNSDDKAHPPIYPIKLVDRKIIVDKYGLKGWKIYDLICRHFLATLSNSAIIEKQKIVLKISDLLFEANGIKIIDEGYWRIYPFERMFEKKLPKVKPGEKAIILKMKILEKKTSPPPFLSEASLLKLMKEYGIGTDATMQEHINTNIKRRYFYIENKKCIPTSLGKTIITTLNSIVPELIRPEVRGNMEKALRRIVYEKIPPEIIIEEVKQKFLKFYEKMEEREETLSKLIINSLIELGENALRNKANFKTAKEFFKQFS